MKAGSISILVVDDEPGIRESLVYVLKRDGFCTLEAASLKEAKAKLPEASLLILDLMLPDGNGLEFLKELRTQSKVPVIVLTSRDEETDRVVGLEIGADDYVTKPFSPREMVARVRAILRRVEPHSTANPERLMGPGGLVVELGSRRVFVGQQEVELSKIEFNLLALFLHSPGQVFERGQILDRVWGQGCFVGDRTVDVHLKSLRKKIHQAGYKKEIIETVRGVGYRLVEGQK